MLNFLRDESSSAADFYVDLGTANTLIAARGQGVVVNEPTILCYSESGKSKKKIVAVGKVAKDMTQKTVGPIKFFRPLKEGVIAHYEFTEHLIKYFLEKAGASRSFFAKPRIIVSLPYGATEVEKMAVVDAGKAAGAKEVYLVDEPMVAAIGVGIDVEAPKGSLIVDIGGGTTEVAVIALSDIVFCEALRVGGTKIDEMIVDYFKKNKNFLIQESLAEELKIKMGTACPQKDVIRTEIKGRDNKAGLVSSLQIDSEDVGRAMDPALDAIIAVIQKALEQTPPELVSDIIGSGIIVSGGGALIRDIDLRIQNQVRLPVFIAPDPLTAIARGGEKLLSHPHLLERIRLEV